MNSKICVAAGSSKTKVQPADFVGHRLLIIDSSLPFMSITGATTPPPEANDAGGNQAHPKDAGQRETTARGPGAATAPSSPRSVVKEGNGDGENELSEAAVVADHPWALFPFYLVPDEQGESPDIQEAAACIKPIDSNKVNAFLERLASIQEQFRLEKRPYTVDIGYHYTNEENLSSIEAVGLLSQPELVSYQRLSVLDNPPIRRTRLALGQGIYTAPQFTYFHGMYGDTCLMVARLKGKTAISPEGHRYDRDNNSVTLMWASAGEEKLTVLQSSSQCVPMLHFPSSLVDPTNSKHPGCQAVHMVHTKLQELVDQVCNSGHRTRVPKIRPLPYQIIAYTAPDSMAACLTSVASALPDETDYSELEEECPVCLDPLLWICEQGKVVQLHCCEHRFHTRCLKGALRMASRSCPKCRQSIGEPCGKSPSGVMKVALSKDNACPRELAFSGKYIVIHYKVPAGKQKDYHPNPHHGQYGTSRVAYLPDSAEGRELLRRLKYAFLHGLTFTVGTSLTTGQPDSVTWASIHHKSSMNGGEHGYPDASYFDNCNQELDALGVPPASELWLNGLHVPQASEVQ